MWKISKHNKKWQQQKEMASTKVAGWIVAILVSLFRMLRRGEQSLSLRAKKRILLLGSLLGALFFLNLLLGALLQAPKRILPDTATDTIAVPRIHFRQVMPWGASDSLSHFPAINR